MAAPVPSVPPAGVPSGNGKYIAIAVLLLGGIGLASYLFLTKQPPQPTVTTLDAGSTVDAATAVPVNTGGRNPEDDIPLPPPTVDAGKTDTPSSSGGAVAGPGSYQCDVKKCGGSSPSDLETALSFRTKQAHRCYDTALSQDPTLRGKITVNVRVGTNGAVCPNVAIVNNEMPASNVAACVANYYRGQNFPKPNGGCIDATIPINFVPRQ